MDCLRAIFAQVAFTFLFDHSQEHANKLTNVLNGKYSTMIHGFGGVQPKMCESIIKADDGYLGMNKRTINAGDSHLFVLQPGNVVPF